MTLIRHMVDRVQEEHTAKLQQLSSIQNEQKYVEGNLVNVFTHTQLLESRSCLFSTVLPDLPSK